MVALMQEHVEHAQQGFEDLAAIHEVSLVLTETRVEKLDDKDRHGRPLYVVVVEAMVPTLVDGHRLAERLQLLEQPPGPAQETPLTCWTGWLPKASRLNPVAVRMYAPRADGAQAEVGR